MVFFYLKKRITTVIDCKTVRILAYSCTREQSNKRSGTRLKTESETWGETRKTLTARLTDFFTDFEKKKPAVLQSTTVITGRDEDNSAIKSPRSIN